MMDKTITVLGNTLTYTQKYERENTDEETMYH